MGRGASGSACATERETSRPGGSCAATIVAVIELRPVESADLPFFFEQQRDPASVELGDVPPRGRGDLEGRGAAGRANPGVPVMPIDYARVVAGHVTSFPLEGVRMVGYWIER